VLISDTYYSVLNGSEIFAILIRYFHGAIQSDPNLVSSEISDLLLFFSYFASQNKEMKSGN